MQSKIVTFDRLFDIIYKLKCAPAIGKNNCVGRKFQRSRIVFDGLVELFHIVVDVAALVECVGVFLSLLLLFLSLLLLLSFFFFFLNRIGVGQFYLELAIGIDKNAFGKIFQGLFGIFEQAENSCPLFVNIKTICIQ